jgi:hypothetical protein
MTVGSEARNEGHDISCPYKRMPGFPMPTSTVGVSGIDGERAEEKVGVLRSGMTSWVLVALRESEAERKSRPAPLGMTPRGTRLAGEVFAKVSPSGVDAFYERDLLFAAPSF